MRAPERGKVIAGRYRLDRVLAQGGMGSVWVGHHLQLDVPVAVKFMSPYFAASAEARARFEREAKASAQLRIANAVQVYDFGIDDGTPFIAMELLDGEDLHARLERERRLTPAATLGILNQVCRGLRRAHEVGLVHRDLKPANIFLSRQGREEVAKILDFGIAKAAEPASGAGATKTGTLLGTPHYMSPEQVRSTSKVDLRTDLWALGVIAFRCVTGQLPFPGDEMGEVLIDVCTKPIPVPSQVAPDLPPELDKFFERALMRDPAQRFQDADELADAFADAQEPVTMLARGAATNPGEPARLPLDPASRVPEPLSSGGLPSVAAVSAASMPSISSVSSASSAGLPPVGTLAPQTQGGSVLESALRHGPDRRTGLLLACAGMLALGAAVALVVFASWGRAGGHVDPAGASKPPASLDPSTSATAAPTASAVATAPTASAAVTAPPATDTASIGAAATSGGRPAASARARGPATARPLGNGRRSDGLLDHP